MDKLLLENLRVTCIIGDLPRERVTPQELILDLELACDLSLAAQSDRLGDTVNYVAVVERIREALIGAKCQMIERAAEVALEAAFAVDPRISAILITVRKPAALSGVCPGVRIFRERPDCR